MAVASYPRLVTGAAIPGMRNALSVLKQSVEQGRVIERPDLAVSFAGINDLRELGTIRAMEQQFPTADQLAAKYGARDRGPQPLRSFPAIGPCLPRPSSPARERRGGNAGGSIPPLMARNPRRAVAPRLSPLQRSRDRYGTKAFSPRGAGRGGNGPRPCRFSPGKRRPDRPGRGERQRRRTTPRPIRPEARIARETGSGTPVIWEEDCASAWPLKVKVISSVSEKRGGGTGP